MASYPARKAAWAVSINPSKALTVLLPRPRNTQEHRPREPASRGEDPEGGHWTRVLQSPGKWQQGAGVERENKRMTDYNLPCQLAAEGRKGKRGRRGPTGKETGLQPSTPPHAARASQVPPRRRPQPPALPDPPRTRFLRSRTPALASPRDKAGQFSPLLGRGDSRGDVNTARPAALGPSPPPPGSVTSSLSPAPRTARPAGGRAARLPLSPSPAPRPLPGGTQPPSPAPSRCHRHSLRKTLRKQHRRGAGTRREAFSPHPPSSLPPASAARALTCSPRRPGRPRRRFPSRQGRGLAAAVGRPSGGSRGLPSSPSRSTGRGGDKTAARRPAQRPPPAPPHRPPTAAATAATVSQARGAMVAPALVPLPAPPSPPASAPPPRPLPPPPGHSTLLPSPRGEGGAAPPVTATPVKPGRLFIPRGVLPPSAPTSPPNMPRWLSRISPGRLSPLVPLPARGSPIPLPTPGKGGSLELGMGGCVRAVGRRRALQVHGLAPPPPPACLPLGTPAPVPDPEQGADSGERLYLRRRGFREVEGYRRASSGSTEACWAGWWGPKAAEPREARAGLWRGAPGGCRGGWGGRSARSGGVGRGLECLVAAAGGRGGGAEAGGEGGAGSGTRAGGHHCSPRWLTVAAVAAAWGRWGGAGGGLCAGRRAAVFGSGCWGGPGSLRTAGQRRRLVRGPCREGKRRRGLPGRRGEQVRARAAEAGGRELGGCGEKASLSRVAATSLRVPARACVVCGGFSGGLGKGAECPRATVGEQDLEKGEGARRVRPRARGARGRAEGRGYGPRRWSRCVYIAARVTSAEKRTELTCLVPRGGQGGGPAPEEARPGRSGRAGGCGRRGGTWEALAAPVSFPVGPRRPLLPFLPSAASWHGRCVVGHLLFSLSTRPPAATSPYSRGDRLLDPLLSKLVLGDGGSWVFRGRGRRTVRALLGLILTAQAALRAG
ncbi:hypothetical protein Cadr_000001508 [Camelus dromedarius]|uniref:Basic proline-rich protein-like n=1 Tax=Camelus dromedarius TaxID=9838 RepID=A0A5N4EFR8_CAMDR|nr:hypothetical protein Cadr_000001508 [Camelus dromedarius]